MSLTKNEILIKKVWAENNKIYYDYEINGAENFKRLFWMGELFTVEYNEKIDMVPASILIIPFLCNVLPIAWVNDAVIYCEELDYTFYKAIPNIKKAYKIMLPQLTFKGKTKVKYKVKNYYETTTKVASFF